MRAMILAAGLGTRLRPITYEMPKPMVPVVNRPVIEHIARLLARHGLSEVIANLHWFPELVRAHLADGSEYGIGLDYSYEEELLGTAGGVRNVREFLGQSFLVISGDALTDIDLEAMRAFHDSHGAIATLAVTPVEDTSKYGAVITGADGRVQGFQEKPDPAEALSNLSNCGIYMFRSEIFDYFPPQGRRSAAADRGDPDEFADWAMDVFPALLESDVPFYAHRFDDYWNDIGSLAELRQGNLDALAGAVRVEARGEISDGLRTGGPADEEGELQGPVLVGPGSELGEDVRIDGPSVIGADCTVGAGARLRGVIALGGAQIPPGAILVDAIAARRSG
jgi:mannose-1-phosphate guanylyltransferase/mannose-1-phosphate guanylyltransferase/phosphomannomutase